MLLRTAIEEFGQRLGMPSLSANQEGLVALDISGVGRLHLEISRQNGYEELLAYLVQAVPPNDHDLAKRALDFCHYRHAHPLPLWSGKYKDNLVVLTRFSEREVTGQSLENAAIFLAESLHTILARSK